MATTKRRTIARPQERVYPDMPLVTVELVGESGMLVAEPLSCYKPDDWSVAQLITNALHIRRRRHEILFSAEGRRDRLFSHRWREKGTILEARLRGPVAA